MASKIRVGTVGATVTRGSSGWGAEAHVPALRALPQYELKAVCTAHMDTARASAEQFGAELAFDDVDAMLERDDLDLIVVSVRVPRHHDVVMRALGKGKNVFCEWPLGATVEEAEAMARAAAERNVATAVGLQARSDPGLTYVRDLIKEGYVGDVLAATLTNISQAVTNRGEGRIWQRERKSGANTFTIAGGHAIDALCFVLGEFREVSARLATTITEWHNTDTGTTQPVDSPDWISVSGTLEGGAQVSFVTATVPANPSGQRFDIWGTAGTISIASSGWNRGPQNVRGARGSDALAPLPTPEKYTLIPDAVPEGSARNVAQAYARYAEGLASGTPYQPDFAHALRRHRLLDAIERSAADGRTVTLA